MKNKKSVKTALERLISKHGCKLYVAMNLRISERYLNMLIKGKIPSRKVYNDIQYLLNGGIKK